jgi:membrane protease subunit HflK
MTDNVIPLKGPDKFLSFLKKLSLIPVILFLALITLPSLFFRVEADEDAVVLRFGKYNRTDGPGLHMKWPWGLEEPIKLPVRKVLKLEFGFRTIEAGVQTQYDRSSSYDRESIMLTGDLNVVDVTWTIQYVIKDAKEFLFNVRNVRDNLFDISQAVMREVVGDRSVTETINEGRMEIAEQSKMEMQKILDGYHMGIRIDSVNLQDVYPPEQVKPAFDDVNSAVQDAKQIANIAEKQKQKAVQEAKGTADKMLKDSEAYKVEVVNNAIGDTKRFQALYEEYRKAPEITKKRMYFDQLGQIMGFAKNVYIVDPEVKGIVPYLIIDR